LLEGVVRDADDARNRKKEDILLRIVERGIQNYLDVIETAVQSARGFAGWFQVRLASRGKSRCALRVVRARQVSPSGWGAASMEPTWAVVPAAGVQQ
jgi:hypothetical protein